MVSRLLGIIIWGCMLRMRGFVILPFFLGKLEPCRYNFGKFEICRRYLNDMYDPHESMTCILDGSDETNFFETAPIGKNFSSGVQLYPQDTAPQHVSVRRHATTTYRKEAVTGPFAYPPLTNRTTPQQATGSPLPCHGESASRSTEHPSRPNSITLTVAWAGRPAGHGEWRRHVQSLVVTSSTRRRAADSGGAKRL
uniref:Uncharacterized protein n=1 Tax=Oryza sativa subsp. japonica TaxID=39947 RepID=Q6I543_ORYSJ|nr:hypothetical protein [Oryza sativa Japonica Group]